MSEPTLHDAAPSDLYRALAGRGYVVRSVRMVPPTDAPSVPPLFVSDARVADLLAALRLHGIEVTDTKAAPVTPIGVARFVPADRFDPPAESWWETHRETVAFWVTAGIVTLCLAAACVATGCSKAPQAPSNKAAPSDHRVEDDCPGGVCTPPPRRK